MNARQEHALLNPLNDATGSVDAYRSVDPQPDGNLLVVVLAVDR